MTKDIDPVTRGALDAFLVWTKAHFPVSGAYLFGSRARGDNRPDSDADVAVLLAGARGAFFPTMLEMTDAAYDIFLETGILIEALPVWEEEWTHPATYNNPGLLQNIATDGIAL